MSSEGRFVYEPGYVEKVSAGAGLRVVVKRHVSLRKDDQGKQIVYVLARAAQLEVGRNEGK